MKGYFMTKNSFVAAVKWINALLHEKITKTVLQYVNIIFIIDHLGFGLQKLTCNLPS